MFGVHNVRMVSNFVVSLLSDCEESGSELRLLPTPMAVVGVKSSTPFVYVSGSLGSPNLAQKMFYNESWKFIYFGGQKINGQGQESQTNNAGVRGSLHFRKCCLLLV